jgi:hypothetical protein
MRRVFSSSVGAGQSATRILSAGPWPTGSVLEGFTLFGGVVAAPTGVRLGTFPRVPTADADFDGAELLGDFDLPVASAAPWTVYVPVRSRLLSKRFAAVRLAVDNTTGAAAVVVGCAFDVTIPVIQRGFSYRPGTGPAGGPVTSGGVS